MSYTQEKKPDIKGSARHSSSSKSACKLSAFEWTERPNVQCWPTGLLERAEPPFSRPGRLWFAGPVFFVPARLFFCRAGFFSPGRFSVCRAGFFFARPAFAGPVGWNRFGSKRPGFKSPPGFPPAKPALCTALFSISGIIYSKVSFIRFPRGTRKKNTYKWIKHWSGHVQ